MKTYPPIKPKSAFESAFYLIHAPHCVKPIIGGSGLHNKRWLTAYCITCKFTVIMDTGEHYEKATSRLRV